MSGRTLEKSLGVILSFEEISDHEYENEKRVVGPFRGEPAAAGGSPAGAPDR